MKDMRKTIAKLLVLVSAIFVAFSCVEVYPTEESLRDGNMDSDYEFTYGLREFMQYSPKNPSGTNLVPFYDFFGSFTLKIYVVEGKISFLEINNGDIPCDQYGFTLPSGKVACHYDAVAVPHALKLESGETIAIFQNGEFVFPFVLDCEDLSYKMAFSTLESTREK